MAVFSYVNCIIQCYSQIVIRGSTTHTLTLPYGCIESGSWTPHLHPYLEEVVHGEGISSGPRVGVVREAAEAELAALLGQRGRHVRAPAHAHHEHYLVVAVVLRERTLLGTRGKIKRSSILFRKKERKYSNPRLTESNSERHLSLHSFVKTLTSIAILKRNIIFKFMNFNKLISS